ncbi:MAG: helix-turn-helix domain-containing protein [Clostridiaceae bacterium]|jgi:repressor LexA|nr:helix-turn-helix domain-containing protein [Clostridiaceae bacterium]
MNNLKTLRKQKGLYQKDIAEFLHVAISTYSYWENGTYDIDNDNLRKIAEYFGVSTDYILGISEMPTSRMPANVHPLSRPIKLPIMGDIRGGKPICTDQGQCIDGVSEWDWADEEYEDGNHFFLRVVGNSMHPTIPQGALVVVRRQDYAERGEVVAFCMDGDSATLKRYYPQSDGSILLQGDNPEAQPYIITPEMFANGEAHIIGVVREIKLKIRRGKIV